MISHQSFWPSEYLRSVASSRPIVGQAYHRALALRQKDRRKSKIKFARTQVGIAWGKNPQIIQDYVDHKTNPVVVWVDLCNLQLAVSQTIDSGQEQRSCLENRLTRTSLPKIPIRHHGTTLSYRKGKTPISNTVSSSSRPRFCESVATAARAAAAIVHMATMKNGQKSELGAHCSL